MITICGSRSAFITTPPVMNESSSRSMQSSRICTNRSVFTRPFTARPAILAGVGCSSSRFQIQRHISGMKASLPNASGPGRCTSSPRRMPACHSCNSRSLLEMALMALPVSISRLLHTVAPSGSGGCSSGSGYGSVSVMVQRWTKGRISRPQPAKFLQCFSQPSGGSPPRSSSATLAHWRMQSASSVAPVASASVAACARACANRCAPSSARRRRSAASTAAAPAATLLATIVSPLAPTSSPPSEAFGTVGRCSAPMRNRHSAARSYAFEYKPNASSETHAAGERSASVAAATALSTTSSANGCASVSAMTTKAPRHLHTSACSVCSDGACAVSAARPTRLASVLSVAPPLAQNTPDVSLVGIITRRRLSAVVTTMTITMSLGRVCACSNAMDVTLNRLEPTGEGLPAPWIPPTPSCSA